jgi:hypothetical protein
MLKVTILKKKTRWKRKEDVLVQQMSARYKKKPNEKNPATQNHSRASSGALESFKRNLFQAVMNGNDIVIKDSAFQDPKHRSETFALCNGDTESGAHLEARQENDVTFLVKQYPEPTALNHARDSIVFVASFGSLPIAATSKETLTKALTEMNRLFVRPASAELKCMRRGCEFVAPNMIIGLWHMENDCCIVIPDIDNVALREVSPAFNMHQNLIPILQNTETPTDGKWDILDAGCTPISSGTRAVHKLRPIGVETKAETNYLRPRTERRRDIFDLIVWKQLSKDMKTRTDYDKMLPILMAMSFLKPEKNWPADFIRKVKARHDEQNQTI